MIDAIRRRASRAAIALLFAASALPAAAWITSPHALFQSTLNNSVVRICGLYTGGSDHRRTDQYTIKGWPATGAGTLRVSSVADSSSGCANVTLGYTGSFSIDQQIRFGISDLIETDGNFRDTGTIWVFAVNPQLAVGDVTGAPSEEGARAYVPVRLRTRPQGDVSIAVSSTDTTEGTVSPSSLTFTQHNWNANQTVTATGANDTLNDGDQTWSVRLNPASTVDTAYNGLSDVDVSMTTVDQTGGPQQNAIAVVSTPANATGYRVGENIEVRLTFSLAAAVTGTPQLAIRIGDDVRQASYASGSGSTQLTFSYPVLPGDADADGISVWANDLTLNGGAIRLSTGTVSARLRLTATITNSAAHKVDGSQGVSGIEAVVLNTPAVGDAYERGENIDVTLVFSEGLHIVGLPQVALNIGTATRQAVFARELGRGARPVFRYTVTADDTDTDGISIGPTALNLNGATIHDRRANAHAVLHIGHRAITNSGSHKVTGGVFSAPTIVGYGRGVGSASRWDLASTPSTNQLWWEDSIPPARFVSRPTYKWGEIIEAHATFDRPVVVTGTPSVGFYLGFSPNVAVNYVAEDSTDTVLSFQLVLLNANANTAGVALQGQIELGGGAKIQDARDTTVAANLALGGLANNDGRQNAHADGGIETDPAVAAVELSAPVFGDTYERGETIEATVTFDRVVDVTGTPQLALGIAANTRQANYVRGTGTEKLVFRYQLVQADVDTDGISIAATALTLNGGTIRLIQRTRDAALGLGTNAITNDGDRKVDGTKLTTPRVEEVFFRRAPASGDTYVLGERMDVTVEYQRAVAVTGAPRIALTIGDDTRYAEFVRRSGSRLIFRYVVTLDDLDTDGASIFRHALTLNGGAINDARDATVAASVNLGRTAFTNASQYKVNGNLGPPGVRSLTLSAPALGDTYNLGETIEATVTFNKAVDVTGTPQLALGIGANTRQANYASGTGSAALVFRYTVVAADVDPDGITIEGGALTLNSGTIDVAGGTTDARLGLGANAFSNNLAYKVDGANAPRAYLTTTPSPLEEDVLAGATVAVGLANTTYTSGVAQSNFTLHTNVPGLTVASLAPVSSGDTTATLTLAYNNAPFDNARTLAVTVAASAHAQSGNLKTSRAPVLPSFDIEALPSAFTLNENPGSTNANTREYIVRMGIELTEATTVTVAGATRHVRVDTNTGTPEDQHTLTFDAANWHTAQTVTVTAEQDDDSETENVTLAHVVPGEGSFGAVQVTVTDDDRGTVLIDANPTTTAQDPGPLLLAEGATAPYAVSLSAAPTANVTVAVASDDTGAATVDQSSLTFTTANWNTPQTVTVTAEQDTPDAVDESATLTHTATGGGYNSTASRLRVGVSDDERTGTDFDADNDGLIEVSTLAQLNAIRWDPDGDGSPSSGNAASYSGASGAFANASTDMGCPAVDGTAACKGYELTQDLDFDTDGDGSTHTSGTSDSDDAYHNGGNGWDPIGPSISTTFLERVRRINEESFNAVFDGNGHNIHNLFISRGRDWSGLFAALRPGAVVRSLGLPNAYVANGGGSVAPLAGVLRGRVEAVWATGTASGNTNVGGLVGSTQAGAVVVASYSKASVACGSNVGWYAGGLAAFNAGTIEASYATGAVTGGCPTANKHGLANGAGTATASYWDTMASGVTTSAQGAGRTTSQLRTPTSAAGIYASWGPMDVDGDDDPSESPWDFGTSSHYPALRYRGADPVLQRGDYDYDGDGLIEIRTLAQLNAVRWDLDGDGAPSTGNAASWGKAFRNHRADMGCPTSTADADNNDCTGYELENDLDFDTDGDGSTHTGGTSDSDDAYHNGGSGWDPIGPAATVSDSTHFNAVFDGKGKVIRNLYVNRSHRYAGLFGGTASGATVRALGVADAYVNAWNFSGALSGENAGRIAAVWTSGSVQGGSHIGGMVGAATSTSEIVASYSTASAQCDGTGATDLAGGLVGTSAGSIAASYSTGAVTGNCPMANKHGLAGGSGTVTASYWDTNQSGIADDTGTASPEGETSANLRTPTGYTALYVDWDDQDVDNDSSVGVAADADDDAWDFGDQWQWPVLKFGGLDTARQIALQPNTAPTFTGTVPNKTYRRNVQIATFQVPAATGGEGAGGYAYTATGLPAGLVFEGVCGARRVCGTPTANTTGAQTVTIYAADGDTNTDDSDRGVLTFTITVVEPTAALTSSPAALTEATLNGAELTVTLADTTFESGVTAGSFTLHTNVVGLAVGSLATVTAGDTSATLTLAYNDTDFDTARTLAVTVAGAAHSLPNAIVSPSVPVTPSLEATATPDALTLSEDSNAANNARTFTAKLDSLPAATTTVAVASADTGAATVDKAALTFTTTDWNTAQTVTVTAQADDDPNDEEVAVTLTAAGVGVLATVTVTVDDDDLGAVLIDANPATPALDPGPLLLAEGDAGDYTVRLSAQPTANTTVAVASGDTGAVTVNSSSLTFTTTNWSTPQTVTATAVAEASDSVDESVLVSHEATGGGYGGTSSDLRVGVSDAERTGTDYDTDEDGLIEISTLAQLNAVRWDMDGNGAVTSGDQANYSGASGAFASASTGMGCPAVSNTATCTGYELTQDLDFDTDGDGASHTSGTSDSGDTYHNSGSGWDPIGRSWSPSDATHFNAVFDGNGHSIHNLYVNRNRNYGGLFAVLRGSAVVRSLGLPNAYVDISQQGSAAPLAGSSWGRVEASWASGSAAGNTNVGGLVGSTAASSVIVASYSRASAQCGAGSAGGLVGGNGGTIVASYATGAITGSCAATNKHGLAGYTGTATASHWDRETSGVATSDQGAGRTTAQLQTPTSATGIFAGWADLDVDGDGDPHESPWHFGTSSQYPALNYRGADPIPQRGDYDLDDDGLIDIRTLAQLNAVRWDLNGDGGPSSGGAAGYGKAFRNHVAGMGCPNTGCAGYELENDLDFDTDGDGSTWTEPGGTFTADSGDAYYNGGSGWDPIGPSSTPSNATHFTATFAGNGHVVANLLVNRARNYVGLFAALRPNGRVRSLGLPNARVRRGGTSAAPLAGHVAGRVAAVWATGAVQGEGDVAGLVGAAITGSRIVASYSTAAVECTGSGSYSMGAGLVGASTGTATIVASYSTGAVTGSCQTASKHGLAGGRRGFDGRLRRGPVTASYWDTDRSGINDDSDSNPPEGKTSANLRAPTGYTGLYDAWDDQDVDGDGARGAAADADDDAWDFGVAWQWPVLKFGGLDTARQFALQPNLPPTFTGTVTDKTYRRNVRIDPFEIPSATGGEGVGYTYTASGLPAGLNFGTPNCLARQICGTPTTNTAGAQTVTIYAADGDTNTDDSDRAVLAFTITVVEPTATLTSTPAALTEATLNGAELTVTLTDTTFESGVTTSSFTLNTNVSGLTVGSVATVTAGDASATLTLAYNDTDFDTARTLGVTVAAAAHSLPNTIVSPSVPVTPSLEATVTPPNLTLSEDPDAANNARTFTARLDSVPAATSTVTVASADAGAATVDKAALTFTTTDWNTAQTVTVTAQADDDANDEEVAVTLTEASVGVLATVTVTVEDDDLGTVLIDADPSTPALDPGPLLLAEGDTGAYAVRLSAQPSADATVAVASGDTGAVTVDLSSLTFTATNWSTPQTVTATAVAEASDSVDESVLVSHEATGGGYGGTASNLRVGVSDAQRTGTDFDVDNDGLIEVSTLAQLNAIRWDLDGDGSVSAGNTANYSGASGAFANASTGMGCPAVSNTATCTGYELTRDLDFDTDGDGSTHTAGTSDAQDTYHNGGSGWDPLGPSSAPSDSTHFNATFDGNGHSIHNLYVSRNRNYGGLFAALRGSAVVRSLGLPNAYVDISQQGSAAPLAGESSGRVEAAWASGSAAGNTNVGGLLGQNQAGGVVVASYSKASAQCGAGTAAGLVANNLGAIVASYATGAVTGSCAASLKHGLAGGATGTATASHWDRETSGVTTSAQGAGRTTAQLKTPTTATGIYAGWADMDVDGDGDPHESPWHFGASSHYPALSHRGADPVPQRGDYDDDDDGLIEIRTLAQLNAMRWDLNGDGTPASSAANYGKAFRNHATGMGCPTVGGCTGYELENDLDFDTDGDGSTHTGGTGDSGDAYYNSGSGWAPIPAQFTATFDGNGKVIANLFVSVTNGTAGLFTDLRAGAVVRALGLEDAYVSGAAYAAPLAGRIWGRVAAAWATGTVRSFTGAGGLVGAAEPGSTIVASYSTATVECTGTGSSNRGGGLTSISFGSVLASYSTGTVTGACPSKAGLAAISGSGSAQASYWDVDRSNIADDSGSLPPEGETSANLRSLTGYTGLYALWDNQDVDGDTLIGVAADPDDDAWDFGGEFQWPVLKFGGHDVARQVALQPNVAPTFGTGSVTNRTYRKDHAIAPFLVPPASGGEGTPYAYSASGLPAGLSLGTTNCASARQVCGTPTANTTGAATVTIHAHDGDTNLADSDRAALTFTITVVTPTATLAASNPTTLTEANLDGAEVTVTLADTTFASGVTQSSFALVDNVPGLAIASLATVTAGDTTATLTLTYTGADFTAVRTLSASVAASAHDLPGAIASSAVNVTPTPGAVVSRTTIALEEDPTAGGGTNRNVGTYTVALTADPTTAAGGNCTVIVTATSGNADVSLDTDATPQTKALTFTQANWNTAQTVTATAASDDDSQDDAATITHARTGAACGGGFFGTPTLPSLTVNVNDDETAAILLDANPTTANIDESGPLALDELSTSSDNSKSYTVRLSAEPTADVTVSVASGDTTALTVDKASLTFTSSNWNTRQTVTATAVQDGDSTGENVTITHAASTTAMGEYTNVQATITANLTDKDTPGFVFDADPSSPATDEAGPLELQELQSSTTNAADYTVRLASLPTQNVTATITSSDTSAVTVGQSTLTFTTTSWNTPQTVTLSAQQDDGGANESVTIAHSAATATSSEYTNVSADFTATVDDDETPAITLSTTALTVPEGNSADYTVRLATEPEGGSVTVTITGAGNGLAPSPTSLTFTAANWNTARSVRVTAATDPNGENEQAMLTHASSGGEYDDATDVVLTATATDSDTPSLAVSPTTLTVDENSTNTYTISLNTQPSATVTVTVGGASGTVTVDTATTSGNQNTLTFTNANWATAQTVTVAAGSDDNARNEEVSLAHTASGGDYASLAPASRPGVTVTVDDDETAGILLDADPNTPNDQSGPLALNENPMATNNSVSYTVRLSSEPTQDATVTIASDDTTAVTVDDTDGDNNNGVQNTLTFTSTNWNTPQTVTLTAADDTNGTPESATITHTASGPTEYASVQATITANTTDDDAPSFVFDADPDTANDQAGPLALEELQSSSTNSDDYTVRLSAQPTQTVTATITSGDTSSVTVGDTDTDTPGDQNTLTFTSSDWNTPQTVTLTAQQDDNGFDENVTITHAARTTPSSEFNNVSGSFTASVTDDETPAITLSATMLTVPEENSRTYTVRLATEPVGGSVTVTITGAENRLSASPTSLTFTTANWDTARTVTVSAANDNDGANETATFSHAAAGADYGSVTAATLTATSTDDDAPSLQVSTTMLAVNENASATYTIRLNTQPSATVTVTVSGASGAVTVDTAATSGNQNTLTFTTGNWATAQTVTVAAGDDGNARNEQVSLTHAATGGDYAGLSGASLPGVTVTVTDNDTAGILLDADPNTANDQPGPIALAELSTATNNTANYTVRLSSEPTQTATITVTSNDTSAVTVDTSTASGVQNTLTFTSANWNTPQTVTLTAAQDTDGVGENVTITHAAATPTASEYTNLSATLTANTTDAQAPGFVFDADPSSPATNEAGPLQLNELQSSSTNTDDYTVRLTSQPTQTVTATITSGNTAAVTVDDTDGIAQGTQNTLTFTASNWNSPQTVTLTAQQDDNGFDESVTITHAAATTTNSEYRNVNGNFTATVNDDETPAIALSTTTLTVPEENSATYTVQLATEPVGGSVTVDITGAANRLSASPTRLIFTTGNWDTARTVRITAANDQDGNNEQATFRHAASGADYGSVTAAELVATSTDNDTPSLQVTPTTLEVDENSSGRYRIRLNTQPTATVTVTVSGASGAVTVDTAATTGDQNALTFTTTTWSAQQTVTVSAGDDGNATDEMLTLTHAASGGDYGSLGAGALPSVQLTVDDDDTAGILVDADPNTPNDQSGPLALNELSTASNNSVDYTVRLSAEPTQDATVTITSNDAAVTVGDTDGDSLNGVQNTLTFTSANWNTPRTVTLTAAEDDNGVGESATITHTSTTTTQSEYTNLSATLTANTTDDDTPNFVFDADPDTANDQAGPLALNELSSSTTNSDDYTVRLYTQPVQTVTATITSNTSSITVDDTDGDSLNGVQNTLTFTAANWATPQTVTLTAQQDDNGFDETATITHRARTTPNSEYTNVDGTFTASVTDDETPAITLSASTLTVPEQNSATYTVQLATEPVGGNATVTITGAADGIAPNPTRLVFTSRNWNTARQVRVSAANDSDSTNEVVTLTHAASGADYGSVPTAAIVVTATDDDTPSLNVSPTRLTVRENRSATYTMRLNTQPSAAVTVTISGTTAEVTVDETALTFTTTNWNATRTVTVTAADDDNATDETVNLLHAATGGDYTGLALASRPGVEVSVDDDDTPAILLDADPDAANDQPGPLALNEQSGHADNVKNYTVRLATEPTAQVEVEVSSGDRAVSVHNDATPRTRTLTFTTTNWATAQTVMATAAEDDDASDEPRVAISHTATGGDYENVSAQLFASTVDDDEPAIVVVATALVASGVTEGGEATYTVRLDTEPAGVARVSVAAEGSVSVDMDRNQAGVQGWLRFDAANWNTPRTASVRGLPDADAASGTAMLRHTSSGADYGRAPAVDVAFAVSDTDTPQVLADATTVEVNEGSTAAYSVTLAAAPTGGTVEVTPTSSDEAVATVSPTTLRFTSSNWNAPQRVTVRGVSDGAANITHPTTGADYGGASTPTVAATVRDEDAPGVRVEPPLLRMEEGGTGSYRVRLNTQPSTDVTVTATSGSSELTLQDGAQQVGTLTLTFTTGNWNAERQVRAQSIVDDDVDDDSTTVTHAVTGYAGVSTAPTLSVEVADDDAPGIAFDPPEGLSLTEGGAATGTYLAVLTARPSATVTVAVSSDDAGLAFDANPAPGAPGDQTALTFTTTNWNVPQTVAARAETDGDAATEEALLLHAASGGGYDGVTAEYDVQVSDADAAPAPARVQASSAGTTSLSVSWSASPGAQGYWVQWRAVGGEWSLDRLIEVPAAGAASAGGTLRVATGALSARIDGLREGVVYEVRVLGLNRGDPGDPSPTASGTPRPRSPAGNRAPVVVAQPEIVLLEVGGQTELDISGLFREPEGDALTYSAASTAPEVATATLAGTTLRIFGGRPGNARIAVTAEDPQGLSARLDIRVGVIGTACSTSPAQAPEGGTAIVTAELASAVEGSTTVRWRIVRDTNPATPDADAGDHGGASGEVEIRAGERCAEIEIPILDDAEAEPAREWFEVELRLRYNRDARLARATVPVAVLEGVCDRTPAVRRALMAATDARGCAEPAPADLRLVRTLDLADARLGALAAGDLGGLPGLRTLDLAGNALSGLPALPEATRLEHLLLAGNALEAVPLGALAAPERLRSLSLSNNALADLPPDAFAPVPGLRSLRLDGNRLQTLPDGLFAGLDSLRMLRLDGNPGAPFALPVRLERTDAEPWAPSPATLRATMPLGAPFETVLALSAEGGTFAGTATESETTMHAGATASEPFTVDSTTGFARVSLTVPELPSRQCLSGPCWQGFALEAGDPLPLFARPLRVLAVPEPEALFADDLRVPLSSLAEAGEPGGELEWSVRSSDPTVATVRILRGVLLVEPEPGAEGAVTIEATATDAHGQAATVRFEVQVEFHWPTSPARGWRGVILDSQR